MEIAAGAVTAGQWLWFVGHSWIVESREIEGPNTVRLHLARVGLGLIEPDAWRPLFTASSLVRVQVRS